MSVDTAIESSIDNQYITRLVLESIKSISEDYPMDEANELKVPVREYIASVSDKLKQIFTSRWGEENIAGDFAICREGELDKPEYKLLCKLSIDGHDKEYMDSIDFEKLGFKVEKLELAMKIDIPKAKKE